MELLEREPQLAELEAALDRGALGDGRLVLLGGEAGIGKTVLVRHLAAVVAHRATAVFGACDALSAPRPLAPPARHRSCCTGVRSATFSSLDPGTGHYFFISACNQFCSNESPMLWGVTLAPSAGRADQPALVRRESVRALPQWRTNVALDR